MQYGMAPHVIIPFPSGDLRYATWEKSVKFTKYFESMKQRPDRAMIRIEWIQQVVDHPVKEKMQSDGRIRRWAPIKEMDGKHLRVILLSDGETVHNAFFDRSFVP
jgi:hypothetical protein